MPYECMIAQLPQSHTYIVNIVYASESILSTLYWLHSTVTARGRRGRLSADRYRARRQASDSRVDCAVKADSRRCNVLGSRAAMITGCFSSGFSTDEEAQNGRRASVRDWGDENEQIFDFE